MKKVLTFCFALLAVLFLSTQAGARVGDDLAAIAQQEQGMPVSGTVAQGLSVGKLVAPAKAATTAKRKASRRAVGSVTELAGPYVTTYGSLLAAGTTDGTSSRISALGTDSIVVRNFAAGGVTVHAAVNVATGAVTIPNQVVMKHVSYGDCDIAVCTSTGKPDRTKAITGSVAADGSISIDGWWGIFVKSGSDADGILIAGYNGLLEKTNGTMQVTYVDTTAVSQWNVLVKQTGKNLVTVKNFGNHGKTFEVVLNADSTLRIGSQLGWQGGSTYGDFYSFPMDWNTGKTAGSDIIGRVNGKTLSWGQWVLFSANRYTTGKLATGSITADFDFSIPQISATEWSGSGTEADPYQIKTLDDLVLLAQTVNNDPNRNWGSPYNPVTKSLLGKYFKVMNDIDMSGYRFDPIGNGYKQRFAGTFDGDGHTLSGLDVSTGTTGYAALFGCTDTASVIKNLTLKDVHVASQYYYTAGVVGFDNGTVQNCHVTGTIEAGGIGGGGVVALGTNVLGCSFDGTINCTGGIAGGVAGQVYGTLANSHARGTITSGGSADTYTAGGVVGTAYGPDAHVSNCYFTGTVDGRKHSNLYVGGVIGQLYKGTADRCFSVANVLGYDNQAAVGGVVGCMTGFLTNSYATGNVQSPSSRWAGGITGLVRHFINSTTAGNDTVQVSVKNCYYAGRLNAEDYLYDSDNEVRETLGTIYQGDSPEIENVYYDKQMLDFTSKRYGVLTGELTSAAGPKGFDASVWALSEGYYPRLKGMESTPEAQQSASVLHLDAEFPDNSNYVSAPATLSLLGGTKAYLFTGGSHLSTTSADLTLDGTNLKLNGTFGTDTLVLVNPTDMGITPRFIVMKVAPKFFEGTGKADKPFLIKNKADLMKLGELTTQVGQLYSNTYFLQTADIDMEHDSTFLCISAPIENQTDNRFAGTYDGGGHTIHNLKVEFVEWKVRPTATTEGTPNYGTGTRSSIYKGLFGQLAATGVVKNLNLAADCRFDVWGYAGTIVGYNYGKVDSCKNYADIYSYSSTVGGLVGYNNPGATVSNCFNAGNVYCGYFNAGGIVGANAGGTIENCQNVGNVEVKRISSFIDKPSKLRFAGGIAGTAMGGVMRGVVNAGHVFAHSMAAGIVPSYNSTTTHDGNNDLIGAVSYGTVFTPDALNNGAIGANGYNPAAQTVGVYFDRQLLGMNATANDAQPGVTPATTAQLTSGEPLQGLDTKLFSFSKGQYPVLKQFASEPLAQAASKIVLTLSKDNETVRNIIGPATLSSTQGTTWRLTQGTAFGISGTTLQVPTVATASRDTLVATLDGFTRPIALTAVTPVPLAGSGTQADPWQLKTTHDWDALAGYMATAANPFTGQYVQVMNDINFADTTFVPLGYDQVTPWGGILLGAGHTVSGIKFTPTATYQGAITTISVGSEVRDLTLAGQVTTAKSYTGGFAGTVKGSLVGCTNGIDVTATAATVGGFAGKVTRTGRFDRCTNKGTITSNKATVAGFAGLAESKVRFTDCVNEGTVTATAATSYAAGFVAQGQGTVFERCANKAAITGEKAKYVAGLQAYTTGADTLTVIDSYNEGAITGASSVAGLAGGINTAYNAVHSPVLARGCYNTGDIGSNARTTNGTAGLFGMIGANSQLLGCYNTGSVVATTAGVYCGGIWGYATSGSSEAEPVIVRGCYNTGNVAGLNYGAGIGGYIPAYATIDSCYNTGEITATFGASGIGNIMGDWVNITDCWNSGNVSCTKQGAGGINGYGAKSCTVTRCFNTGDITAGSNAGGLGGQSMAIYTNCYNRGTVSAPIAAGGLVGKPDFNRNRPQYSTSLIDCYNAGRVLTNDSTKGSLIGQTLVKNWDRQYNVVSGTSYVTDWGTYEADTLSGATAMTIAQLAKTASLSGEWSYGDDYSFPVIKGYEHNDCARAFAAAVVLKDVDTYDNVTGSFWVGKPEGVSWTDTKSLVWFGDDNVAAATKASQDDDVLIATCGQHAAKWPLKFNTTTGVSEAGVGQKPVLSRTYYNVAGVQVLEPEPGQVLIEVTRYTDGSTTSRKVISNK